ncbi:MAG: hypothetical protein WCK28_00425 [Burkholderiales bacterium]|jgi:hypothetical protein
MTIEELVHQYYIDVRLSVQSERAHRHAHESADPKERLRLALAYHQDMSAVIASELALFEAVDPED